jgi:hypothetical protein
MTCAEAEGTIREWFRVNSCGGLVLPDGWYGRPFDNQHRLTSIKSAGEMLEVYLDGFSVVLSFDGLSDIHHEENDLVLTAFRRLLVKTDSHQTKTYAGGQVRLKSYGV